MATFRHALLVLCLLAMTTLSMGASLRSAVDKAKKEAQEQQQKQQQPLSRHLQQIPLMSLSAVVANADKGYDQDPKTKLDSEKAEAMHKTKKIAYHVAKRYIKKKQIPQQLYWKGKKLHKKIKKVKVHDPYNLKKWDPKNAMDGKLRMGNRV